MIPTETKEIDGTTFEVRGLDLRTERAMFVRLVKLLGPAITDFAKTKDQTAALAKLLEVVDNEDLDYLILEFGKVSKFQIENGSTVPLMDAAFKNGISTQMKWLWFCLEHQYASFLGAAGSTFLQDLKAKASA